MTKMRLLALLAVVALVLFPAIASAQLPPELPCGFYGTVQVDGADVPEGTVISALIDGNVTATTTTTASSTYSIKIPQPEGENYAGKTVTFMIDTDIVDDTGVWEAGGYVNVDLSVGEAPGPGGCTCTISDVVLGNSTYFDSATNTLYIKKADITGPQGPAGATGAPGAKGDPGKDASNVIGIVAIIIAAIALIVAVVVMMRKQAVKT